MAESNVRLPSLSEYKLSRRGPPRPSTLDIRHQGCALANHRDAHQCLLDARHLRSALPGSIVCISCFAVAHGLRQFNPIMSTPPQDGSQYSVELDPDQASAIQIQRTTKVSETTWHNPPTSDAMMMFRKAWRDAIDDNYLTLFGFRRFRTAHLINLRFLEQEIDKIDHQIYQAGLRFDNTHIALDRLALKQAKKDVNMGEIEDTIDKNFGEKLRYLLKQYGR